MQRLFIASMTLWLQRRLRDEALKPAAEFKAAFSLSVISMDSNGFSSSAIGILETLCSGSLATGVKDAQQVGKVLVKVRAASAGD